jgi:hypothetical protein
VGWVLHILYFRSEYATLKVLSDDEGTRSVRKAFFKLEEAFFRGCNGGLDYKSKVSDVVEMIRKNIDAGDSLHILSEVLWEAESNIQTWGSCCGKHSLTVCPLDIFCRNKWCPIQRNTMYYEYGDK